MSACSPHPLPPDSCTVSRTFTVTDTTKVNWSLDLVFVIDDSAAMSGWQAALATALPALMNVVSNCDKDGVPPSLHLGVISSDMGVGAAGTEPITGCAATGDSGHFHSQPEGMCTDATLAPGDTFISDVGGRRNFTAPDDPAGSALGKVFPCIAQLGDGGCGFGQPLASLVRALGADAQSPPAGNFGFLRPDASLGIVIISNQDDCSVPPGTTLFAATDSTLGPLTHYRCNHAGHLCRDAEGQSTMPPLAPPPDATSLDGILTLPLSDCVSAETDGSLTPISKLVADLKALKVDPDNQIFVASIVGPPSPYVVRWPGVGASPQVAPSCGSRAVDGSGAYAEPAVRIAQFTNAFPNSAIASVCEPPYTGVFEPMCAQLGVLKRRPCIPNDVAYKLDAQGARRPDCVVTDRLTWPGGVQDVYIPACSDATVGAACWSVMNPDPMNCLEGGQSLTVTNPPTGPDPADFTSELSISCQLAETVDAGTCPN